MKIRDGFARFAALSALAPFVAEFFHEHDFVVAYAAVAFGARSERARPLESSRWQGRCWSASTGSASRSARPESRKARCSPPRRSPPSPRSVIGAKGLARSRLAHRLPRSFFGSVARDATPGPDLARRTPRFHGARERFDRGTLAGRTARERFAGGRPGLGLVALPPATRLRAAGVRYISTFIMLSNGVIALG